MKHNPLFDDLCAAFPPHPIAATRAFEQRGIGYCDADEYRARMEGRCWDDLDPQYVASRSDGLCFLGDEQYRAVLPLYLHLLIVFKPTSPVVELLIPGLTLPELTDRTSHPDPVAMFEWRRERFEALVLGLSEAQKRILAATLLYFIELYPPYHEPASVALDRYWRRFAA